MIAMVQDWLIPQVLVHIKCFFRLHDFGLSYGPWIKAIRLRGIHQKYKVQHHQLGNFHFLHITEYIQTSVQSCYISNKLSNHPTIQLLNPYHAEFLEWNNAPYIFGTVHYHFKEYQGENLKVCQPTIVQSDQALYWWQRLIAFGVGRIRVNLLKSRDRHMW